jgi:hypothetical protein
MIISNKDLNDNTIKSLTELLDKDISPKSAFDLLKISSVLEELVSNKNTVQNKILQKYARRSQDNPEQLIVDKENIDNFQKEMEELMNIEHEINMDKIKVEDLQLSSNIKTKTLGSLSFLFDIELPEVKTLGENNS